MKANMNELLEQMTLIEKVSLLAGMDLWHTAPIPRLGIPSIKMSDGPNGVRGGDDVLGPTSICFPVGAALGATWNPDLIRQVGSALARSAKAKNAHILLAPTVNIHRTPIAGRNFECYAEDPFLSGSMAAAYIQGLQEEGVAACIKHFVANDQEFERFAMSSEVAERPLHEIYLEPFRIALQQANPWSLMSAYNRINGTYASENDALLRDLLKGKWAYDGYVISDWFGTYSDQVPSGDLDLEMPGPARYMAPEKVLAALEKGDLDEARLDDKVRRLLRLMERVGAVTDTRMAEEEALNVPADRALARQTAAEAIVLLKNENNLLPLQAERVSSIAVIGENAKWAQIMGGGSAEVRPHYMVSPLEGIESQAGDHIAVSYALGTPIHRRPHLLDPSWLTAVDGETQGLTLEYFDNLDLAGVPIKTSTVQKSFISWFGTAHQYLNLDNFSLRLSGSLTVPENGLYELQLTCNGKNRLTLDGLTIIDNWRDMGGEHELVGSVKLDLEAGKPYQIVVEFSAVPGLRWRGVRLGCQLPISPDPIQTAVDLAAEVDVAVIFAGLTLDWESEGFDRPDIDLVGQQNELITRVAAVNPNTVVLLNAGSPLAMPWLESIPSVVQMWYLGQETGNAVADVLFGAVNPSGRLPLTFPQKLEDNPAFINYPGENGQVHYGEGIFVGYRYYDKKTITPLFPFGHGLSYTSFTYENLRTNSDVFHSADQILVSLDITNTGTLAGHEVVQLYVRDVEARLVRPSKELKAFKKIFLEADQTKRITFALNKEALSFYDPAVHDWVSEPGIFELLVGSSSQDIRLHGKFELVD